MIASMAFRNMRRNPRRTAITLTSIGFGLFLSIIFTGVGDYQYDRMINGAAKMGAGHVAIIPKDYLDSRSLDKTIHDVSRLSEVVAGFKNIVHVSVKIIGQAMVATASESSGAAFIAIDPARENPESVYLLKFIREGSLFSADDPNGIVIGKKLSRRLGAELGSKIVYTTTGKNGELTSGLARVRGIFETGVGDVDEYFVMLPLSRMQKILGYETDEATQVSVILEDHIDSDEVRREISRELNHLEIRNMEVVTWRQSSADMAAWVTLDSAMNYLFQIIFFLLISAGILNTILMSVLERTHEFGVMLALGLHPRKLVLLVITEALWLSIFGITGGLIFTGPIYYFLNTRGIDLSSLFDKSTNISGILLDLSFKVNLRLENLEIILAGIVAMTLISSLYPAWRASRISPVKVLQSL
jgi:ABC-type lipoprotein release transport system permease subunit